MAFVALEKLSQLQNGYRRNFLIQGIHFLLIVEGNKRFLFENRCPHMGKPLTRATISSTAWVLRCPHHGFQFDLLSGKPLTEPATCNPINVYRLAYEGNVVGVEL